VKLDNGRTACTSAEEDEAVPRPNIADASGLAASVDDDDDLLEQRSLQVKVFSNIL